MTTDMAMSMIEKFLADKNVGLSESEKAQLERLLEDLYQTGYSDGYFSGCYEEGDDFAATAID